MARKKVEAVTGCFARAQDNEPLFVLRATDALAPAVVRTWADVAESKGTPPTKIAEARQLADEMEIWAKEHGGPKVPD